MWRLPTQQSLRMVERETGLTLARKWRRALTPPVQRGKIVGRKKLARQCWKHPGPWRHLQEQVMRMDCTTRRPASDRRRVFLISAGTRARRLSWREALRGR